MNSKTPIIGINTNLEPDSSGEDLTKIKPEYWQRIAAAGAVPMLMPQLEDPALIDAFLDRVDGFLMIGGGDISDERMGSPGPPACMPLHPLRERSDFLLLERLLARRMPTLAICLSCQELNVALGGTLWRDLPSEGPPGALPHAAPGNGRRVSHAIEIAPGSALHRLMGAGEATVNSYHHQAIRELGAGLVRAAWSADGLTEAVEVEDLPFFLGVQWHPERAPREDEVSRKLFAALIESAVKL